MNTTKDQQASFSSSEAWSSWKDKPCIKCGMRHPPGHNCPLPIPEPGITGFVIAGFAFLFALNRWLKQLKK